MAGWVVAPPVEAGEVVVGAAVVAGADAEEAGALVDDGADALDVELAEQPAASASTARAGPKASRRRAFADELFTHASFGLEGTRSVDDTLPKRMLVPPVGWVIRREAAG